MYFNKSVRDDAAWRWSSLFVYVEIFICENANSGGIGGRLIDRIARGATIALHSLSYLAALICGPRFPSGDFPRAHNSWRILTITSPRKTRGFSIVTLVLGMESRSHFSNLSFTQDAERTRNAARNGRNREKRIITFTNLRAAGRTYTEVYRTWLQ